MEHSAENVMLKNQETKPDSWRVTEIRDEPMVEVIVGVEKLQAVHVEGIETEGDSGDTSYLSEVMAKKEEECHDGERVPPPEPPDLGVYLKEGGSLATARVRSSHGMLKLLLSPTMAEFGSPRTLLAPS